MGSFQEDVRVYPGNGRDGGTSTCRALGKKLKVIQGGKKEMIFDSEL